MESVNVTKESDKMKEKKVQYNMEDTENKNMNKFYGKYLSAIP